MITVKADFSRVFDHGRKLRVNSTRASGPLVVGERVRAVEPDEDLDFTGVVSSVDEDGFALLDMDWEWDGEDTHAPADFGSGTLLVGTLGTIIAGSHTTISQLDRGFTVPSESSWRISYERFDLEFPNSHGPQLLTIPIHVAPGDSDRSALPDDEGDVWVGATNTDTVRKLVTNR